MSKDWIHKQEIDPRLPTDPDFVSIDSLTRNYNVSNERLIELAVKYPALARTSAGNPWTESEGREVLFLNEPAVSQHLQS